MQEMIQNPHGDGRYIPALDGWRAIAILMVICFHGLHNTDSLNMRWLAQVTTIAGRIGALGVLVFFAISGFIITSRLYKGSNGGRIHLRSFFIKRAFRILPAAWVVLLLTAFLGQMHLIPLQRSDWSAPVFLANYFEGSWYTQHFWSLSVEEHFYVVWPFCILLAGWRRAIGIGAAIIAGVAIYRPYALRHLPVPVSSPDYAYLKGRLLSHTEARVDYIMFGGVIALALQFYPAFRRLVAKAGSGMGTWVLLLLLGVTLLGGRFDTRTLQAGVIALLVCSSSITESFLSHRLLGSRAAVFLGKISYSIYLWQQLVLADIGIAWYRHPLMLPVKFAVVTAVAYCSYHLLERPMIRMGRALLDAKFKEGEPSFATVEAAGL